MDNWSFHVVGVSESPRSLFSVGRSGILMASGMRFPKQFLFNLVNRLEIVFVAVLSPFQGFYDVVGFRS